MGPAIGVVGCSMKAPLSDMYTEIFVSKMGWLNDIWRKMSGDWGCPGCGVGRGRRSRVGISG